MIMKKYFFKKCISWLTKNQNESLLDRLLRVLGGEILVILAYFWLSLTWSILAWMLAALMFFTASIGYCHFYQVIGVKTHGHGKKPKLWQLIPLLVVIAFTPTIAGYCSVKHTSENFMRNFDAMDIFIQQSLRDTTVGNRGLLVVDYAQWQKHFERFYEKYRYYRPFIIKYDSQFCVDLKETAVLSSGLDYLARQGNLGRAGLELQKIDEIWTEMKQRNRIPIYDLAVIGFERVARELVAAASRMDAPMILVFYPRSDLKLREMEANFDSPEIKMLRQALENLLIGAQEGRAQALPRLGVDLEIAFSVF